MYYFCIISSYGSIHSCDDSPRVTSYKSSLLIFQVNLVGRTASGLLDRWLGREEMSSACAVNDAGNGVSDADGMKNIWRKYMEKLLNVERMTGMVKWIVLR